MLTMTTTTSLTLSFQLSSEPGSTRLQTQQQRVLTLLRVTKWKMDLNSPQKEIFRKKKKKIENSTFSLQARQNNSVNKGSRSKGPIYWAAGPRPNTRSSLSPDESSLTEMEARIFPTSAFSALGKREARLMWDSPARWYHSSPPPRARRAEPRAALTHTPSLFPARPPAPGSPPPTLTQRSRCHAAPGGSAELSAQRPVWRHGASDSRARGPGPAALLLKPWTGPDIGSSSRSLSLPFPRWDQATVARPRPDPTLTRCGACAARPRPPRQQPRTTATGTAAVSSAANRKWRHERRHFRQAVSGSFSNDARAVCSLTAARTRGWGALCCPWAALRRGALHGEGWPLPPVATARGRMSLAHG